MTWNKFINTATGTSQTIADGSITRTKLTDYFSSNDGVFGVGSDCNTMHKEGYYMCVPGIANGPAEFSSITFYLEVLRISSIYSIQRAISSSDVSKIYFRKCDTRNTSALPSWTYIPLLQNNKLEGKRYTALGDSITAGNYPSYTADALKMSYVKNAYGGTTFGLRGLTGTDQQFDDNCFFNMAAKVDFTQFDIVTIGYGTNDYGTNCVLGTANSTDTTTSLGGLNVGLQTILNSNPTIKVMLCTPIYRPSGVTTPNTQGLLLSDYVQGIKDVAKKYYVPVCDFHYGLGLNSYNSGIFLGDGLHPTLDGHRKMSDFLIGQMWSQF